MIPETLRLYGRDRKGNVAIIFALSLIPAVFLIGMALDFSSSMQRRSQLDAAADAGALAAVTPSMMMQSDAAALTAATNIFNAEASAMSGVSNTTPTVTITPSNGGLTRTALVSYNAWSINNFPNVLGQSNWTISGSSTATATAAPNINFYLLLDNSPSMDLPATSAGITAMINATQNAPANGGNAGGCAFACHESNPAGDNLGNPNGEDNYTLAQNLGVVTRIQNMNTATQSLMTTASTMEVSNNVTYQMAIYTFNYSGTNTIQALTSDLTAAQNAAQGINVLEVYDNNYLTSTNDNNDTDTDFDTAMQQMNTIMPNPGTGAANSTPQEVLFLVTDGVEDKVDTTCSEPLSGSRCQQPFDTIWCTTMKSRGILIAVLYTEYLPLPASGVGSNSWYNTWIAPFQSQIGPNMQSCASPGLFFQVTTDGDITAAMNALFLRAVATARLSQ
ncbi:MAG: TadE/TadG family type IV pilus assembly protein [Steroidobacteraceae bacterium]